MVLGQHSGSVWLRRQHVAERALCLLPPPRRAACADQRRVVYEVRLRARRRTVCISMGDAGVQPLINAKGMLPTVGSAAWHRASPSQERSWVAAHLDAGRLLHGLEHLQRLLPRLCARALLYERCESGRARLECGLPDRAPHLPSPRGRQADRLPQAVHVCRRSNPLQNKAPPMSSGYRTALQCTGTPQY